MIQVNNDQVSSCLWLIFALVVTFASVSYGLGTLGSPGTGFLPFLTGLFMSFFAFVGVIHSTWRRRQGVGWKPKMEGLMWPKSLIVVAALVAYVFLLIPLGFSLCTALFIGFLLRAVQPQKWPLVIVGAIGTAAASFMVFEVWLQAQLPKGPWGF
jgi:putative tricarboxylic transport membrane protein